MHDKKQYWLNCFSPALNNYRLYPYYSWFIIGHHFYLRWKAHKARLMSFPLDSLNLLLLSLDEKMDLHRFAPGKYVANGMQICSARTRSSVFTFLWHICKEQICAYPFFRPLSIKSYKHSSFIKYEAAAVGNVEWVSQSLTRKCEEWLRQTV